MILGGEDVNKAVMDHICVSIGQGSDDIVMMGKEKGQEAVTVK